MTQPNLITRAYRKLRGAAIDAGLLKYKVQWDLSPEQWDAEYNSGKLDVYGAFRQQFRYGVLVGLMRAFPRPARILDVGCGVGILRARVPDENVASYIGLDPSKIAIEMARKQEFAASRFVLGTEPTPQMGDFDLIVLNEMLCYVHDLPALLNTLKGHLAPDGLLLTSLFRHPGDGAIHREICRHFAEIESVTIVREVGTKYSSRVAVFGLSRHEAEAMRDVPMEETLSLKVASAG